MNTKLKLELLKKVRDRKGLAQGFTLVELMIVVAVIGLLSAVALPQYLQARNAAAAGARIGEAIGKAKECATSVAAGGIGNPGAPCDTQPSNYVATWGGNVTNLRCLAADSSTTGASKATIAVDSAGSMTCTFG